MKKFLTTALFFTLFSSSAFAASATFSSALCLTPYVGADAAMRYSPFKKDFGGNVFKQYYPEGNVFLGVKFSDYLGVELGYKASMSKTRTSWLNSGNVAVGVPVVNAPALHRTVANFKGWHTQIVGSVPIYGQDCFSLLGSMGVSRTKLFATDKIVQDTRGGMVIPYRDDQNVSTFSKTKNILNLGVGLQIAMDEKLYFRLKANWENLSRFKSIIAKERTNVILQPKNSITYSIGVVFNFF